MNAMLPEGPGRLMADAHLPILIEQELNDRALNAHTSCDEGLPRTSDAVASCLAITAAF